MKTTALLLSLLALSACSKPQSETANETAAAPAPYKVVETFEGPAGSYDYASVDGDARQLFIGRSYGVMRYDLRDGQSTTILERKGVAAVLPIAGGRLMLSTNWDMNSATLFDRDTGAVVADLPTGKGPDGAYHDAASGLAFVMNGDSKDVTFIDIASKTLAGAYMLPGCNEPTGIAYDAKSGLLMSACHNGVTKLIDAATGADKGQVTIGQGADGIIFDPARRIGYVSCIDGTLTIFALDETGKPTPLQTVKTREGARTLAFDAKTDRIYLPAATVVRDAKGEYVSAEKEFSVTVVGR